jgi:hypothetical protein
MADGFALDKASRGAPLNEWRLYDSRRLTAGARSRCAGLEVGDVGAGHWDPTDPLNLEEFLDRLRWLRTEEARELAEVSRVLDWRNDRDLARLLEIEEIGQASAERHRRALRAAGSVLGPDGLRATRSRARSALAQADVSWPGIDSGRRLRIVALVTAVLAALVAVLGAAGNPDVEITIDSPVALPAAVAAGLLAVSIGSAIIAYLLPPSRDDLRSVVENAAIAHAAGPGLSRVFFEELAGGWYAVLQGRWRRGPRPYFAWAALGLLLLAVLATVVVLAALGRLS